jgi:hypothetical protein
MLVDLEAAQIVRRRRIGRAAQKSRQAPDMPDIVMLRMRAETPHHHIVLHPLTQWVDGCLRDSRIHGKLLFLKELQGRTTTQHRPKPKFSALHHSAYPSREAVRAS